MPETTPDQIDETAIINALGVDIGSMVEEKAVSERLSALAVQGDIEQWRVFVSGLIHQRAEVGPFRKAHEIAGGNTEVMITVIGKEVLAQAERHGIPVHSVEGAFAS